MKPCPNKFATPSDRAVRNTLKAERLAECFEGVAKALWEVHALLLKKRADRIKGMAQVGFRG